MAGLERTIFELLGKMLPSAGACDGRMHPEIDMIVAARDLFGGQVPGVQTPASIALG